MPRPSQRANRPEQSEPEQIKTKKSERAYDERGNVRPADGRWSGTRVPAKSDDK